MEIFERVGAKGAVSGEDAFKLHDTFGFPLELTKELAGERGIEVDEAGFRAAMEAQRERSRTIVNSDSPPPGPPSPWHTTSRQRL